MADPTQALASLRERLVFTRRIHSNESIRIGFQQAIDILDEEASKAAASPALGATAPVVRGPFRLEDAPIREVVNRAAVRIWGNRPGPPNLAIASAVREALEEIGGMEEALGPRLWTTQDGTVPAPLTEDVEEGKGEAR